MPIGVNVNNPQEQNPIASQNPVTGEIVFGGNALGSGASTSTTATTQLSTILLYGALGLGAVFIFQRIGDK